MRVIGTLFAVGLCAQTLQCYAANMFDRHTNTVRENLRRRRLMVFGKWRLRDLQDKYQRMYQQKPRQHRTKESQQCEESGKPYVVDSSATSGGGDPDHGLCPTDGVTVSAPKEPFPEPDFTFFEENNITIKRYIKHSSDTIIFEGKMNGTECYIKIMMSPQETKIHKKLLEGQPDDVKSNERHIVKRLAFWEGVYNRELHEELTEEWSADMLERDSGADDLAAWDELLRDSQRSTSTEPNVYISVLEWCDRDLHNFLRAHRDQINWALRWQIAERCVGLLAYSQNDRQVTIQDWRLNNILVKKLKNGTQVQLLFLLCDFDDSNVIGEKLELEPKTGYGSPVNLPGYVRRTTDKDAQVRGDIYMFAKVIDGIFGNMDNDTLHDCLEQDYYTPLRRDSAAHRISALLRNVKKYPNLTVDHVVQIIRWVNKHAAKVSSPVELEQAFENALEKDEELKTIREDAGCPEAALTPGQLMLMNMMGRR